MEKKILGVQDIEVGMKVRHEWIVPELVVVLSVKDSFTEISLKDAKREAADGFLYIGEAQEPFLKL
jgi:hypothetical protein